MNLKLILIILFFLGALLFSQSQSSKSNKRYIFWCSFWVLLSVSLKCASYGVVGADTYSYIESYKGVIEMSFGDVWQEFVDRYFHGVGEEDIGFLLLQWFFTRITSSYHLFSTVADLLFYIPFAMLINRYCTNILEILFAFLLYLAIFHTFAMYGARQFFVIGLGILFFLYYSEKRYKAASIALFIAVTIHLSVLLVLIPFGLSYLSGNKIKKIHIVALCLIPLVIIYVNPIISFMGDFIGSEKYAAYGEQESSGGAITYIILSEVLSLVCLFLTDNDLLEDEKSKFIYAMAPVFTFFAPLIFSNGSMIRITAYSQIYVCALIPYLVEYRFAEKGRSYLWAAIIILLFLILKGGYSPYEFFWKVDSQYLW